MPILRHHSSRRRPGPPRVALLSAYVLLAGLLLGYVATEIVRRSGATWPALDN